MNISEILESINTDDYEILPTTDSTGQMPLPSYLAYMVQTANYVTVYINKPTVTVTTWRMAFADYLAPPVLKEVGFVPDDAFMRTHVLVRSEVPVRERICTGDVSIYAYDPTPVPTEWVNNTSGEITTITQGSILTNQFMKDNSIIQVYKNSEPVSPNITFKSYQDLTRGMPWDHHDAETNVKTRDLSTDFRTNVEKLRALREEIIDTKVECFKQKSAGEDTSNIQNRLEMLNSAITDASHLAILEIADAIINLHVDGAVNAGMINDCLVHY